MNVDNTKIKWVEKYRPQTIDDMVLTPELKSYFENILASKKYVNMSLIASPGIGKTTLARALAKCANAEVLSLNCASGDGKVESIQTKLLPFAQSMPFDDHPMFVILDELDSASATGDSSFQKALRNVIEASPNITYIATANYGQKIIPAILSRCPQVKLQFTPKDVLKRLKDILDNENIKYTVDSLKDFVTVAVKAYYPDLRTIVNMLQSSCSSGELIVSRDAMAEAQKGDFIAQLVEKVTKETDILEIRKFYLQNKDKISDFTVFAGEVMHYILDKGLIKNKGILIKATDSIYQMNLVIDKELGFFQFLMILSCVNQ